MSKFDFRLDVLLRLKKQFEQDAKNRLAKAIKEHDKLKADRDIKIDQRLNKEKEQIELTQNKVTIEILKNYTKYLNKLDNDIKKLEERVNKSKKNVDNHREELKEILKDRQILEKLREKEYEKYRKEIMKKEQIMTDELTGYKNAVKDKRDN